MLPFFLSAAGVAIFLGLTALGSRFIIQWLSNRPDSKPEWDPIKDEDFHKPFPEPASLAIVVGLEYLPIVLDNLRALIEKGLERRHTESLRYRIENHRRNEIRTAVYPVTYNGTETDLHLQWRCPRQDEVSFFVIGLPELVNDLRTSLKKVPTCAAAKV